MPCRLSVRVDLPNGTRFGPGKAALLRAIRDNGSISAAARALGMSYPRAHGLVDELNTQFGAPLVTAFHGGRTRGGARVSSAGDDILARYDQINARAEQAAGSALDWFDAAAIDRELSILTAPPRLPQSDHPADVLHYAADWSRRGVGYALVIVAGSRGGSVRADGALMLVPETGDEVVGYVSNGCVDADVALQAREALAEGRLRRLKYGAGSPFIDIRLPCGGSVELLAVPSPDPAEIIELEARLEARRPAMLQIGPEGDVRCIDAGGALEGWTNDAYCAGYQPKTRLRLAGRGAETLAFLRLALASGFETLVQSPDAALLEDARDAGAYATQHLATPSTPVDVADDAWTAFMMMFHDHDWEAPLLAQALDGPAFYIGALGSRRTHAVRCETLKEMGCAAADIARVHGPVGLIPSLREASLLAVSALAEIISVQQARSPACV